MKLEKLPVETAMDQMRERLIRNIRTNAGGTVDEITGAVHLIALTIPLEAALLKENMDHENVRRQAVQNLVQFRATHAMKVEERRQVNQIIDLLEMTDARAPYPNIKPTITADVVKFVKPGKWLTVPEITSVLSDWTEGQIGAVISMFLKEGSFEKSETGLVRLAQ